MPIAPLLFLYCVLHGVILTAFGRVLWCAERDTALWVSDAWNIHTSQHLFDPYTFSHVQHGMIFFAVFSLFRIKPAWALWIALITESGWEILENSPLIIERYRTATASLGYYGDSILNSVGDLVAALGGFIVASRLPWKPTLLFYLLIEAAMLVLIRDSLTLNVVMLVYPLDAIKAWQASF